MRPIGSGGGSPFNPFIQRSGPAWMPIFANASAAAVSGGVAPPPSTGMVAWFRKNTGQIGAGFCSQWTDQSGSGNHLLQAVGANQPSIPGDGTLLFDGLTQFMGSLFVLVQPSTVYLRVKMVAYTVSRYLCDGGAAQTGLIFMSGASPTLALFSGSQAADNGAGNVGAYFSAAAVFNGASSVLQIASTTTTGNPGAASMAGFTLGARAISGTNPSNIQVAEAIVYNVAHDATQRAAVITYLNTL